MNINQKDWFCTQCCLHFDRTFVFGLHMKLVHKKVIEAKVIETEPKTNESIESEAEFVAKSDTDKQIASVQRENFQMCSF